MSEPGISLVIPVRDEERSLEVLARSIRAQTRQPDEVILVDGGSTDRTVSLARELFPGDARVHVVEAGPATPGRGRNVGAERARFEWLAFTDAGIRLEADWLARLVEARDDAPLARVVYGSYEPVLETFFERAAALAYADPLRERPGGRMRGPFIASSLVRKDVWLVVGGFPDLRAGEDLIFMERVAGRRIPVAWAPGAVVHWSLRPTLASTFRRFALHARHNARAGLQSRWHHAVLRMHLVGLAFVVAAVWLREPLWLLGPALGLLARTLKSVWTRRESVSLVRSLNPAMLALVAVLLVTIDLALHVGWAAWIFLDRGRREPTV